MGRRAIMTKGQGRELREDLLHFSQSFYGETLTELRHTAAVRRAKQAEV
jgi:hypothetical protein